MRIARDSLDVTFNGVDFSRLPDALAEGASLFVDLKRRGVIEEVGRRVKIRRKGGFSGLEVWLTLLLYMTTGASVGLRKFWDKLLAPHVKGVAALAGRKGLPSPASLSRALDRVETALLREQTAWLLTGIADVFAVMRHAAAQTYDAAGDGWHVFDFDPTVKTLRHRSLPTDDDLPEPIRESGETAAPGHSGRKRGDVQFRDNAVQHAGSGIWVHAHLSKGNGDGLDDFEPALDAIVATCARLDVPCARALLRMDGEFSNVPWFSACRERGLPFVTCLNRRVLYDDPEVLERLRTATWFMVPDSLSGPQRSATDLGMITVRPDARTRRSDRTPFEPVKLRIIASRYPREGKANRGRILDGWQVELFAFDADAERWSASDGVAQFFGRAAQENRFGQEDRELGLDRIVSYHLPGQELATLVGLSVWNLRIARGFELEPPPRRAAGAAHPSAAARRPG